MSVEVSSAPAEHVETESRPKGAYRTSWGNTWFSMVQHNNKRTYLGTFSSPEAAAEAYRLAKERVTSA
jgi:hypothetical protein